MSEPVPDDLQFRSLAAPGLEEDDVFATLLGLPMPGPFWGQDWPRALGPEQPWSEESERRRRHEELLARWRAEREEPEARA